MQIISLRKGFVADVADVDVGSVDATGFEAIRTAWTRYPILRFRDQVLDDAELQAFSRGFGPLEYAPMGRITDEERAKLPNPYVATISNIVMDGEPIGGLGSAEAAWHTDMSYIEDPPAASISATWWPPCGRCRRRWRRVLARSTSSTMPPTTAWASCAQDTGMRRTRAPRPERFIPWCADTPKTAAKRCFSVVAKTPTSRACRWRIAKPCSMPSGSTWHCQAPPGRNRGGLAT